MFKTLLLIFICILTGIIARGQQIPVPKHYSIVDTAVGDLNNDGESELVVAYNTKPDPNEEGVPRELIIYKKINNKWTVWQRSMQALYGSRDGGMSGDPYEDMSIAKGILQIDQNGGSSWKWGNKDKYRYQDGEFVLIGYISLAGKACEYWEDVDFNLITRKMIIKKEYENCDSGQEIYKRENETFYASKFKITLQDRSKKEIKIISPKYHHEIYLAIKND